MTRAGASGRVRQEEDTLPEFTRRAIAALLPELDASVDDARAYETLVGLALRQLARHAARAAGLPEREIEHARLFDDAEDGALDPGIGSKLKSALFSAPAPSAGELGRIYEGLIAHGIERDSSGVRRLGRAAGRKRTGSFYTPDAVARVVAERALDALALAHSADLVDGWICDPAMGAGAFLMATADALAERAGVPRSRIIASALRGVDSSPTAVAVAEVCLWLYAADPELSVRCLRDRLVIGDSLAQDSNAVFEPWRDRVVLVIGNPPWVAFAGRAAQPLDPDCRAYYGRRFRSWRGYPTLHGLFIERAAEIAPQGVVALLVPSPIADLDGYRAARLALTSTHRVIEPLLEFGQDAFEGVTQPCFALIAAPAAETQGSDRRWQLAERQLSSGTAAAVLVPDVLADLAGRPSLPAQCFRELGFQTSRRATTSLLLRASAPDATHQYPLLEGRDVQPFRVGPPRLYIDADPARLKWAGCRLRPESDYRSVRFVIRQTAKVPIAALHTGLPFRNSLLAGFDADGLDAELLVGLLNSALYRALHLSQQRDARQAVFPQVKIGHLRSLPLPPPDALGRDRVREVCRALAAETARRAHPELDAAVFDLFQVRSPERRAVLDFVGTRAPELGHALGLSEQTASANS